MRRLVVGVYEAGVLSWPVVLYVRRSVVEGKAFGCVRWLNKTSRTVNKGWYSRFRVGRVDNYKNKSVLRVCRDSSVGIATGSAWTVR